MPDRIILDLTANCPVVLFKIIEPRPSVSPPSQRDWEYFQALLTFGTKTSFSATFALFTSGDLDVLRPNIAIAFSKTQMPISSQIPPESDVPPPCTEMAFLFPKAPAALHYLILRVPDIQDLQGLPGVERPPLSQTGTGGAAPPRGAV